MRYAEIVTEKCWKGYEKKGMKTMFGKRVPNCVKKEDIKTLKCSHLLCTHCINKIKPVNNLCPYCKQDIIISTN